MSVALEVGDGHDSASNESTHISQCQPELTGITSGFSTPSQPEEQHNEHQTSTGNIERSPPITHTSMYQAAFRGNWPVAEYLLERDPNFARVELTERGDRALHIAAATKQTEFVRKLVEGMNPDDLLLTNKKGYTAFHYAAASGIVKIAEAMMKENQSVVINRGSAPTMPIYMAALLGHTDMVSYLYRSTPIQEYLSTEEQLHLLLATIRKNMYDVALGILQKNGSLASTMNEEGVTALYLLVRKDISSISISQEAFLESVVPMFAAVPCLSWLKRYCEQTSALKRARLLAEKQCSINRIFTSICNVSDLLPSLHDAVKVRNLEFITMLTQSYPDLISQYDYAGHTMFHVAVMHRQEKVFSLIHQIGALKDVLSLDQDWEGNNILHLAGQLPPRSTLDIVAGAALQVQRELMWFEEVEKIVPPLCLNMKNKEGLRPRELFSKRHEGLLTQGEIWMKDRATSCMLTATLTATVVFAAANTVPGGTNSNTGSPILLKGKLFTAFVVSDAAAMFFSISSIIIFLSIQTSHYQEEDFLESLPRRLIFGLTALFFSIVSTIVAFASTCVLLFAQESAWVPKLVAAFACFSLIILYVRLHYKVWIAAIRSTYWTGPLFRYSKHSL